MALVFNTTPTLTVTVGNQFAYTCSAIENHPAWSGTSAITHFQVSAVRGPVSFDSRFTFVSATDATAQLLWYPRVSDVVSSAVPAAESIDLTLTVYGTSGNYTNQDLSISADTSAAWKRKTTVGDIQNFEMRGLGR